MRKVLFPLILPLAFGIGKVNADDKPVKRIHVDSTNIAYVRSIPNVIELNVSHGDTTSPFYNFYLSSRQRNSGQGGFAATIDGLAARIKDKISGKVGKEPEFSYVLIYRQQQNPGDSLSTPEWNKLMKGLGRDSIFFYIPKVRDDYIF